MLQITSHSLWIVFLLYFYLLLNRSFTFHVEKFLSFFEWWFVLPILSLSYGHKLFSYIFYVQCKVRILFYFFPYANCFDTIYWLVHPFSLIYKATSVKSSFHICLYLDYPFCSVALYQSPNQCHSLLINIII